MQFLEDQRIEKLKENFLTYSGEFATCLVDGIVQVSVNPCKDAEFKFNMMLLSLVNFIIISYFRSSGSLLLCITLYLLLFFNLALKSRWLDPTGKVIFITNVDSGYGQELAKYLINRGAKVIAGASDPMASSLLQLREDGVYLIKFDISSDEKLNESMMRLRLRLSTWSKDLHGVVVNSGVDAFGDFEWSGVKYLKKITEINVWQIAELIKDVLELVRPQKSHCRIAFHSNHLVDLPEPGNLPLTLSKSALRCLVTALQSENRNSNVFFSSIYPGVFCYNNPCILSLENRDALQKNIMNQMSPQTKKILKSIYLEKRIQYCTSRFEGFNSLEPVLDYYFDALFSLEPELEYFPVDFQTRAHIWLRKICPSLSNKILNRNALKLLHYKKKLQ